MIKQIRDIRKFQKKLAEKKEGWMLSEKAEPRAVFEGIQLRKKLLQEEVDELEDAMKVGNSVEVLDAGIDILYILLGTMHEAGVLEKFSKAWDLVHENNMTKLDENGRVLKNEFGKVIKPKNYKPVDLKQLFS